MAKKRTTTIKTLENRINTMNRKPKRRKPTRRKRTTALSAAPRRRRRKRSLLHDRGGLISSVKANTAGAVGGILFAGLEKFKLKPILTYGIGFAGAIVAGSYLNVPNIAAGLSGAIGYSAGKMFMPTFLGDDLQDTVYVDPATLSDSGFVDDNGNPMVQDSEGVLYALNDDGDLQAVGDAYALSENMQSAAMIPLSNAYALSDPYALNDRFEI